MTLSAILMLNSRVVLCQAIRIIRVKNNILNRQEMLYIYCEKYY